MKIKKVRLSEISLAPYNPRKISKKEKEKLRKSLEEFGYVDPIIVNKRTGHVVGGNQRVIVLREMGVEEVDAVEVDLSLEEEKALNLALNKIAGDWDLDKLAEVLDELVQKGMEELTGFDVKEIEALLKDPLENTEYTLKVPGIVYEPLGLNVELSDCYDDSKYRELLKVIEEAEVSDEIKDFLRLAAMRFIEFDFENIAEYYAQAPKEVQELFEKLVLVIVDFDKAIAEGFVELREELRKLWERGLKYE